MIAGTLEIQLLANMARLQTDMDQAKRSVGSAMSAIEKSAAIAKGALIGLGAVGLAYAFASSIKGAIDLADSLNKLSQRTGVAVEALSQMQYAAKLADVSSESLTTGFKKLNVSIAAGIAGDKEKVAIFKALGITLTDAAGRTKTADQVLLDMADTFAKSKDGAGKTAAAVALLGKAGDEMIPLLNGGSQAIRDLMKEADKLGLTIGSDFAKQAEEFNDNLTRIKVSGQKLSITIASELVSALGDVLKVMSDATIEGGKFYGVMTTLDYIGNKLFDWEGRAQRKGINSLSQALADAEARAKFNIFVPQAVRDQLQSEVVAAAKALESAKAAYFKLSDGSARGGRGVAPDPRSLGNPGSIASQVRGLGEIKVPGAGKDEALAAYKRQIQADIEAVRQGEALKTEIVKRAQGELDSQRRMGYVSEQDFIEQNAMAEINALGDKRDGLMAALALQEKVKDTEKEQVALRGQIAVVEEQQQSRGLAYGQAVAELQDRRLTQAKLIQLAEIEADKAAKSAADTAYGLNFNEATASVNAYAKEIKDANGEIALEVSLLGKTEIARDTAIAQYRVILDFERRSLEIKSKGLNAVDQEAKLAALEAVKAQAMSAAADRVMLDSWQKSVDQYNDVFRKGFADMVNGGEGAWKAFTKSLLTTFKTSVADQIYKAFLQPFVVKIVAQMVGITNGIGGAGGSGLSGGASLLNSGMSLGNTLGTAYANVTGTGIDGLLATNAAFGTAEAAGASMLSTLSAAAPYVAAAIMVASMLEKDRGGPKTEGGGDVAATIQAQYDTIANALGIKTNTRFGAFTSQDTQGDALTQLQVSAFSNDQNVYSRQDRLGGFENVGRSQEELTAAIGEETTRAIFAALKASDLETKYRQYLDGVGDSATEQAAAITRLTTARALEEKLLELSSTDAQNLARAREKELAATDPMLRGLLRQIYAQEDLKNATQETNVALSDMTASLREAAIKTAGKALDALSLAVDAEKKDLAVQITAANTTISKLESLAGSLASALGGINQSRMDTGTARAQILAAVAIARAGGPLPEAAGLQDALSTLGKQNSASFKTAADMARDTAKSANAIQALGAITEYQLSTERQALLAAQEQVTRLDGILTTARQQLEATQGNSTAILSLAAALSNFRGAVNSVAAITGISATGVTNDEIRAYIATGASDREVYDKAMEKGVSAAQIAAALGVSESSIQAKAAALGVPAFATGVNYVPNDTLAYLHEGEEVRPASYVRSDRESIAALVEINEQLLSRLDAIQRNTRASSDEGRKTNNTLTRVTRDGNSLVTVAA